MSIKEMSIVTTKELKEVKKKSKENEADEHTRAAIVREGNVIKVPEAITLATARDVIQKQLEFEEQTVQIERWFEGIPWADAALAINKAMEKTFMWVDAKSIKTMFDEQPPRMVKVKSGPNGETINVPVGHFALSLAEGAICQVVYNGKDCGFGTRVKRKYEKSMNDMLNLAEKLMVSESLYRGKALTFKRMDHEVFEEEVDEIGFMQVGGDFTLLLSDDVQRDLKANIWTLLTKKEECIRLGIPTKRSVLMYGPYGTGKTLAAHQTAKVAAEAGYTFIYVTDVDDLSEAHRFARTMSPAVLFVEDIDRHLDDAERVSDLSTVLDGINTKETDVILIATTNHVEKIPPILLRPGRIDASIEVGTPDSATVRKLIQHYAPTVEGDIDEASAYLAGNIPAVIREACERAKLFALASDRNNLTGQDICDAAKTMTRQMILLKRATEPKKEPDVGNRLHHALHEAVRTAPNGQLHS